MSVDRIATGNQAQLMLAQIQKAQVTLDRTNQQVVTGKVSDTYSGYGDRTAAMESARSAAARAEANVTVARQAETRLDLQDTQLSQLSNVVAEVRTALTRAAADQDATAFMDQLQGLFSQAVEILNAKDANGYMYGGDNNQTPPVTVTSLNELAALPSVANAFANGSVKTTVRLGEAQTIEVGVLASDLGSQLFSLLRDIAQFDAGGSGPFGTATTAAQQSFLESRIQPAIAAVEDSNQQTAANGIRYQRVRNTLMQLEASVTVHKGFVAEIQDVDIAAALANLNQNQIALQAAFQVTSTLNQLSMLNFLR